MHCQMDFKNNTKINFFFSRQRYVLGDGAMHKLAKANVLIIGLGGVGVEIGECKL